MIIIIILLLLIVQSSEISWLLTILPFDQTNKFPDIIKFNKSDSMLKNTKSGFFLLHRMNIFLEIYSSGFIRLLVDAHYERIKILNYKVNKSHQWDVACLWNNFNSIK